MKQRLALAGCSAFLLFLSGCDQLGNRPPTPAETNASFEAFVKAAARKTAAELTPEELKEALNQYIGMQVAAEAARTTGLDKDPAVKARLDLGRANVLSESLLQGYLDANPISDADLQAEYDTQRAATPSEYRARHILVDDKALAEAVIEKLKAGGDFAALAKLYSKDGSAQNGGDLGWFNPQTMVQPFASAVKQLEKGKFSLAPVQTQFGWHVIQLDDTRSAQLPPLEQVKDRVKQLVQRKKVQAHLEELRKESKLDADKLTAALTEYASTPQAPPAAGAGNGKPAPADAPFNSAPAESPPAESAPAEVPEP